MPHLSFAPPAYNVVAPSSTLFTCVPLRKRLRVPRHTFRCTATPPQGGGNEADDDSQLEDFRSSVASYLASRPYAPEDGPLSFASLDRAGRDDLMALIIRYGGYERVSDLLDLDRALFVPPVRAAPTGTFPGLNNVGNDPSASIRIGRDLENRLSTANTLPSTLPASISSGSTPTRRRSRGDDVPSADELVEYNQTFQLPVRDVKIPPGETFSLTTPMRLGLLLCAVCFVGAHGQTSLGLLDAQQLHFLQSASSALLVAHASLALYAGTIVAPRFKRDPTLWSIKVLLAGPAGIRNLQALGSL